MPQKMGRERTRADDVLFKWMLWNVSQLFVRCSVLILLDRSYMSRFWTQFEAWVHRPRIEHTTFTHSHATLL
jgi:hypothetical protein